MSNMSYCRFRNTEMDLQDCYDTMSEGEEPESKEEKDAKKRLINLCVDIAIEHGYTIGRSVEED